MVPVTFYDSSIDVLDNLWEKHLKRNQIMEKPQQSTLPRLVFGIVMVSISLYVKNI